MNIDVHIFGEPEIENEIKQIVKTIIDKYEKLFYEIVIKNGTEFYIEIGNYILGCIKQKYCKYAICIIEKEDFESYKYWKNVTFNGKHPKRHFSTILEDFSSVYIKIDIRTSFPHVSVLFSNTKKAIAILRFIKNNIDKIFEKIEEKYLELINKIIIEKL